MMTGLTPTKKVPSMWGSRSISNSITIDRMTIKKIWEDFYKIPPEKSFGSVKRKTAKINCPKNGKFWPKMQFLGGFCALSPLYFSGSGMMKKYLFLTEKYISKVTKKII